jgi:hypothetical protein
MRRYSKLPNSLSLRKRRCPRLRHVVSDKPVAHVRQQEPPRPRLRHFLSDKPVAAEFLCISDEITPVAAVPFRRRTRFRRGHTTSSESTDPWQRHPLRNEQVVTQAARRPVQWSKMMTEVAPHPQHQRRSHWACLRPQIKIKLPRLPADFQYRYPDLIPAEPRY